ncbi:hypothetical protein [Singulisphaera acidiphila]|uniref:Uncharacterized protein n=1 Tax=Singulisphaera acidiphila (strain ATCC BAA-1392 / DSM 18658 / VKM B-2454 / MOB10) TaxID=886293 RepID=L0D9H4_SINAD|nr:hypothetical protein [Singulisphaera acidiphila]AGA26044.1 hypothetical protein Sinac_1666 [Singulisphaera acidiphila DSM 18658]
MTNLPIQSAQVNPTITAESHPHINPTPFTAPSRGPEPVGRARSPKGRYTRPEAPYAVREVFIPGAWAMGWQVSEGGRIYASREAAMKFAAYRASKLSQASVNPN